MYKIYWKDLVNQTYLSMIEGRPDAKELFDTDLIHGFPKIIKDDKQQFVKAYMKQENLKYASLRIWFNKNTSKEVKMIIFIAYVVAVFAVSSIFAHYLFNLIFPI